MDFPAIRWAKDQALLMKYGHQQRSEILTMDLRRFRLTILGLSYWADQEAPDED